MKLSRSVDICRFEIFYPVTNLWRKIFFLEVCLDIIFNCINNYTRVKKVKISFPNMISLEQWRASIGLWDTLVKRGQKRKNPESLKQKYFSQTSPIHSTWFADVNNCPKLL